MTEGFCFLSGTGIPALCFQFVSSYISFSVFVCKKAIIPTQQAIALMIMDPSKLMIGKTRQIIMILSITQRISMAIITWVNLFEIGVFVAVNKTNRANIIKNTPTPIKGVIILILKISAAISGNTAIKIPVNPELMALISKTCFSFILSCFDYPKLARFVDLLYDILRHHIDNLRHLMSWVKRLL